MIDWLSLVRNGLWIFGLSLVLAGWSYASWLGRAKGIGLRAALARPAVQLWPAMGMWLFCAGLAWGSERLWERGLWVALAVAFLWTALVALRHLRA